MARSIVLISSLFLPGLLAAQPAAQQPDFNARIESLHRDAVTLYRAGRYREALPKFEAANALFPDATLVYNIGRCHEGLGEIDAAERRYAGLVANPNTAPEVRAKARERIEAIATARAAAAVAIEPVVPRPPPPPKQSTLLPWVVVGTGAALLVVGGSVFGLGAADHGELEASTEDGRGELTRVEALALEEDGDAKKAWGVGLLVGGSAVAVGGLLWLLWDDLDAEGPVRPIVDPDAGAAGLTFHTTF